MGEELPISLLPGVFSQIRELCLGSQGKKLQIGREWMEYNSTRTASFLSSAVEQ